MVGDRHRESISRSPSTRFFHSITAPPQLASNGVVALIFSICKRLALLLVVIWLAPTIVCAAGDRPEAARIRTFQFTYAATITGLKPGQDARVWLPVPPSDDDQEVEIVTKDLPAESAIRRERPNGNRILYLQAKANDKGEVPLRMVYRVKRHELKREHLPHKESEDAEELARLREPNKRVPIVGKPLELIEGKKVPADEMEAARLFYNVVNDHMRYSKEGTGWGNGDSVWACENGRGNCTDFHSLFLSLVRSRRIPAKFEIGFGLPTQRGSGDISGYHCWAKFHLRSSTWVPVDISEANKTPRLREYYFGNLSEDRVAFSTGRDLNLIPRQAGAPLNFFIYPYVEVDGKEYPQAKVPCRFSFRDEK
jgi:transglutaminase-like putative cysteine protease